MKITYSALCEIPSKTAHSIYSVKIAEALSKNGHEVLLLAPKASTYREEELKKFYNISYDFKVKLFRSYRGMGSGIINPLCIIFSLSFRRTDLIIINSLNVALFATLIGLKIIYDAHGFKPAKKKYQKWMIKRFFKSKNLIKLVVVTNSLKEIYINAGVSENKIFVIRNGTGEVQSLLTKSEIVNSSTFNVGYIGHLYKGKGMEVIESIAPELPNINFHIVGGHEQDIAYWKNNLKSPNVIFHGFVNQSELSQYINSFDVCLLPNQLHVDGSGRRDIGSITCPMKMFDYMAHKKPIIASDLPVLREVLDDKMAIFCNPNNPKEWITAILKLQNDKTLRTRLADKAYQVFEECYTWKKRAEKLIESV